MTKLIRIEKQLAEALVALRKYVKDTTGSTPTYEEIANMLKNYFILNEIGNQIRYQRKKNTAPADSRNKLKNPFWTLNLISRSHQDNLAKAGLFAECVQESIRIAQEFIKKNTGQTASLDEIAESLQCSFILSEIKNQIIWQRKNPGKASSARSAV